LIEIDRWFDTQAGELATELEVSQLRSDLALASAATRSGADWPVGRAAQQTSEKLKLGVHP
jgi:hypothetical protein